ncbi:MAG: hypothetical protein BWZ07_01368 [Alphaproteobacteria bacterium ADurb.BinA280]|nr:MAG: hypothetical protein BWZ07_01368 [Alphaproteobacteria bacterium ADurb.BinA280]
MVAPAIRFVDAMLSPGAVIVGPRRPSTAGPRLEKLEMPLIDPARKFTPEAVTITFLASLGAVSVEAPGPEFPAENTTTKGSAAGVSKSPSRTIKS